MQENENNDLKLVAAITQKQSAQFYPDYINISKNSLGEYVITTRSTFVNGQRVEMPVETRITLSSEEYGVIFQLLFANSVA